MPALIFDCDGVLADTEKYGHLPAFNETFAHFGVPVRWSEDEYAEKVKIGGGKERMRSVLSPKLVAMLGLGDEAAIDAAILAWHKHKTAVYTGLVNSGLMPARPGIVRVVREARDAGWALAVASTSAEPSVRAVLTHAVGPSLAAEFDVFAGDVVPRKKPASDIYLLALEELGLSPQDAVVVEDSRNGLLAALGAGLRTVVTVSSYTREEDFEGASLVLSSLGDADKGELTRVLADPRGLGLNNELTLSTLQSILALPAPASSRIPAPTTTEAL